MGKEKNKEEKEDVKTEDTSDAETETTESSDDEVLESSKSSESDEDEPEGIEEDSEDGGEDEGDDAVLEAAIRIVSNALQKKQGKKERKPIVESAKCKMQNDNKPSSYKPVPFIPTTIFEAGNIAEYQEMRVRDNAMTIVQAWIDGGDYTYDAIYALCVADADFDKSGEIDNPEEVSYYNEIIVAVADALTDLGVDTALAQKFINREDDEAGDEIGNQLSETMGNEDALDPGDVINKYAVSGVVTEGAAIPILESGFAIRDGKKVKIKKKRIKKPRTSAQKAAQHKASMKAHSSSANAHRNKSMKVRHQKNL